MESNQSLLSILRTNATIRSQLQSVSSTSTFDNSLEVTVERCAVELTRFVLSDDYVEGEVSKTQLYLEKLYLDKDARVFRETFQKSWVRLFSLDNPKHLYTFACIASCLPYEWLDTYGITLILGCAAHKNALVNEACIRMAEAWETPEHANHLENMTPFDIDWLEEYRVETIAFLKELS